MLSLCGHIKYEDVDEMTLVQRVEGVIANYLGDKDELAVISEAVSPPVERFDASLASPLPDQEREEHERWMATWANMGLSHVYGFPLWEEEVFHLLQRTYAETFSIFAHYSKSGSSGTSSATAAMTMQQSELGSLVHDIGLATEVFPIARVNVIFTRADQAEEVGHKKGGNKSLEFHEFLEAVVMLSFHRANPAFGQTGGESVPAHTLPDCLLSLLERQLLKLAKHDKLAKIKRSIKDSSECQEIFKARTPQFRTKFDQLAKHGTA